ncbi:methyl-accepting chemotaxis protein [Eubacteriaceae bacterium ES2]|nr:methyl-accepting chemotaxis protein [Eubacteriaceae bacterium ES2]
MQNKIITKIRSKKTTNTTHHKKTFLKNHDKKSSSGRFKKPGLIMEISFFNVLILLLSLSLIGLISFYICSHAIIDFTKEDLQKYAAESADHVSEKIAGDLASLETLATQSEIISMNWDQQKTILAEQINRLNYSDMAIMDLSGQAVYAGSGEHFQSNQEAYFQSAFNGISTISDLVPTETGNLAVFELVPIKNKGTVVGLLIGQRDPFFLQDLIENINDGGRQYGFILTQSGHFIAHPSKDYINNQLTIRSDESWLDFSNQWAGINTASENVISYNQNDRIRYAALSPIMNTNWVLVVAKYEDYVLAPIINLRNITIITALAIILIASLLSILIGRRMTKPILMVKEAADSLARGDVNINLKTKRKDEIRDLVDAFQKMVDGRKTQNEILSRLSAGDLSSQITPLSDKDIVSYAMINLTETIQGLLKQLNTMRKATANGDLSHRGDVDAFAGEFKSCLGGINEIVDSLVTPLYESAHMIQQIGQGQIPPKMTGSHQGDFQRMQENFNACIDGLQALKQGDRILNQMSCNQFSDRLSEDYHGIFGSIATAINLVQDKLVQVVEISDHLAKGQIKDIPLLDELKATGPLCQADQLNPNLIMMMDNLEYLSCEIGNLTQNAKAGQLAYRGKSESFNGEYRQIISGINETLDAIVTPIESASLTLHQLAKGNLQVKMAGSYPGDYSIIQRDLNHTIDQLNTYIITISSLLSEIGKGNLNLVVSGIDQGDFIAIKRSIETIIQSLNQTLGEINAAVVQVNQGSHQISREAQSLASGAQRQTAAVESLSRFIVEMKRETIANANNANQANRLIDTVAESSQASDLLMTRLDDAMQAINLNTQHISEITSLINMIAFQTKILSLNAAIEAARAGQHGKGFSIVANEVRNLANRTSTAAQKIESLIGGSVAKVEAGNLIVNETSRHLKNIHDHISMAAVQIDQIAKSSDFRAQDMNEISLQIDEIKSVTQANAAASEESASASEELFSQAQFLEDMIRQFTLLDK